MVECTPRVIKSRIDNNYCYIESNMYSIPKNELVLGKYFYERKGSLLSIIVIYNNYRGENIYICKKSFDDLLLISENKSFNKTVNFIDEWFMNPTSYKIDMLCMSTKITFLTPESYYGYIRIPFKKVRITPHNLIAIKEGLEEEYYFTKHQLTQQPKKTCIIS